MLYRLYFALGVEFFRVTCSIASVSLRQSDRTTFFGVKAIVLLGHRLSRKGKERYPATDFYPRVKTPKPQKICMERENETTQMLGMGLALT